VLNYLQMKKLLGIVVLGFNATILLLLTSGLRQNDKNYFTV